MTNIELYIRDYLSDDIDRGSVGSDGVELVHSYIPKIEDIMAKYYNDRAKELIIELVRKKVPMTNITYMELKNELVFRVTEEILIPPEQMVLEPYVKLTPLGTLGAENCPYCMSREDTRGCSTCPMERASNKCTDKLSTFNAASELWYALATDEDRQELFDLAVTYNGENEK